MSSGKSIKISDLARIAKVSTATVSRTLNKPETVAKETRDAVLKAAEQTGYRMNLAARNLRRQRTGAVVILVPNLGNPFFSEILAGIESTLASNDLSVLMVDTQQSKTRPETIFDYLHHSRADGIISLDGSLPSDLLRANQVATNSIPIVFACEWHEELQFPSIRADNEQGCQLAIEHLVSLGHRKIGYISGPGYNVLTPTRLSGTIAAMKSLDVEVVDKWFYDGDFSLDAGAAVAEIWLNQSDRPTAIFCANDEVAMGLISELYRHGVEVPNELSVVGFDDIDIAARYVPSLTTISQPRPSLGAKAAELLIARIDQPENRDGSHLELLEVKLVARESTRAVP